MRRDEVINRCIVCHGTGKMLGIGCMLTECKLCKGEGFIKQVQLCAPAIDPDKIVTERSVSKKGRTIYKRPKVKKEATA